MFLNYNSDDKLTFVFNEDISDAMSCEEWHKLLDIINAKLQLYFNRYDGLNSATTVTEEVSCVDAKVSSDKENKKDLDLSLSILEITNLSARAKNILMRNKLYTIGEL